jgi:hypothetical protein
MRTGPFSEEKVIGLLNKYFVPVYAVNEDYAKDGPQPAEEKAEYQRIYRAALDAKRPAGTVHVYLLSPDGKYYDSMHVAKAAEKDKLAELLENTVKDLKVEGGKPLVKPTPQSVAPAAKDGGFVLHLTARPLKGGGSWGGVSENWIVLSADEVKQLLPAGKVEKGRKWDIGKEVTTKLLKPVYPVTENNDLSSNRIDKQELKATVISNGDGVARAKIEGDLKMKHTFYPHREDNNFVEATLVGYVDFEPATQHVRTLRLVTDPATYGGGTFGAAVRSMP